MFDFGTSRRISIRRLFIVALGLSLFATGVGWLLVTASSEVYANFFRKSPAWFSPYVDVTSKPAIHFEGFDNPFLANVVIGSVEAHSPKSCEPSWRGKYDLDAAARALDLDRRLVRFSDRGGRLAIRFAGDETHQLAAVCPTAKQLAGAYTKVLTRYGPESVEFQIPPLVLDQESRDTRERRLQALHLVLAQFPTLKIWFNLPGSQNGLTNKGIQLVSQLIKERIKFTGITLFPTPASGIAENHGAFGQLLKESIAEAETQMTQIFDRAQRPQTARQVRKRLGIAFDIGRSPHYGTPLRPIDASSLINDIKYEGISRVSFESLNRDVPCGANADMTQVLQTCSGVDQELQEFSQLLTSIFATRERTTAEENPQNIASWRFVRPATDPSTAPYPVWHLQQAYDKSDKVVWQGRVYKAKWSSRGERPDEPIRNVWDSPWRYLGPVLRQDEISLGAVQLAVTGRTPWTEDQVFVAGDEVVHDDRVYRAKWWTQGNRPVTSPRQAYDHPWLYRGSLQCEDGSCIEKGVGADLIVDFLGLDDVDVEIRENDGQPGSAGRLIQLHRNQSGRKTYSVVRDSYDVVVRTAGSQLLVDSLDCREKSCTLDKITSTLSVDYEGLSGINLEIRADDETTGMAGALVQSHLAQGGQKTYRVLRGSYDLAFTKGASSALIFDGLDCRAASCAADSPVSTLYVDYGGLKDIHIELRRADGVSAMAGDMVASSSSQSGQKTYQVLRSVYDVVFRMATTEYVLDDLDCSNDTCEAKEFSSVLSVDYGGLSGVTLEIRERDKKLTTAGRLLRGSDQQGGFKTYHVLRNFYDVALVKGAAELIVDSVDCRGPSCLIGDVTSDLAINLGTVPTTVEIRSDDGRRGTTGMVVDVFKNQVGDKRYPVLRGRYDVALRDKNWSLTGDAINCSASSCKFDVKTDERTRREADRSEVAILQSELMMLRQKYTEGHPNVVALRSRLNELTSQN
jgi:chitinase